MSKKREDLLAKLREKELEHRKLVNESEQSLLAVQQDGLKKHKAMVRETTAQVAEFAKLRDADLAQIRTQRLKDEQEVEKTFEVKLREMKGARDRRLRKVRDAAEKSIQETRDRASAQISPINDEYRRREAEIDAEMRASAAAFLKKFETAAKPLADEIKAIELEIATLDAPPPTPPEVQQPVVSSP